MYLSIENVSKTFTTSFTRKQILAVKDFSLSIDQGEIFGIVGPNGAGKSTVLKMLMGFIRPDRGKISLLGKQPADPSSRIMGDVGNFVNLLSQRYLIPF